MLHGTIHFERYTRDSWRLLQFSGDSIIWRKGIGILEKRPKKQERDTAKKKMILMNETGKARAPGVGVEDNLVSIYTYRSNFCYRSGPHPLDTSAVSRLRAHTI